MRLHLVSLPHTQVSPEFCGCAYTAKVLKFCKMLGDKYEILLYAPEGPEVEGAHSFCCLKNDERIAIFGEDDPGRLPAWPSDEQTYLFNRRAVELIRRNLSERDLILLTGGWTHRMIQHAFPGHICCEPGVGYQGISTKYCAFESYAWMHYVYAKREITDGRWFDTVIPNYFDPDEFPMSNGGDYLMFLGRLIECKGPYTALEIAKVVGLPLVVAGAGAPVPGTEHVGPVTVEQRAKLLAGARALLAPTTYMEPFGGVAVEAMMCGTPAITTDWGAFTETVPSEFRFRTLSEAIDAVERCTDVDPKAVREYAMSRYSLNAVAPQFERWFNKLNSLWDKGWYS